MTIEARRKQDIKKKYDQKDEVKSAFETILRGFSVLIRQANFEITNRTNPNNSAYRKNIIDQNGKNGSVVVGFNNKSQSITITLDLSQENSQNPSNEKKSQVFLVNDKNSSLEVLLPKIKEFAGFDIFGNH